METTTGESITKAQADLTVDENSKKIVLPSDILLTSFTLVFDQVTSVCELVVAGISADNYQCSEGKFLDTTQLSCQLCPAGWRLTPATFVALGCLFGFWACLGVYYY